MGGDLGRVMNGVGARVLSVPTLGVDSDVGCSVVGSGVASGVGLGVGLNVGLGIDLGVGLGVGQLCVHHPD